MNKDDEQGTDRSLAWAGGIIALALGATFARKLGYIDGDTVTRVVIGLTGLLMAWYGNRIPKAVVPNARSTARPRRVASLVPGAERARLCRTVGVRPDPGGDMGRVRRGRGGDSGDARLLPVAAGQGESRLIQAFFEARQPRWQKVPDPAVKSHPSESSNDNQSSALMPADCDLDRGSVVRPDECIGRGPGEGRFPGRHTRKPGRFGRGRAPSGRRGGRVREERHDRRRRAADHQEPQDDLARGLRRARSRRQTSHGARHDLQHPLDDQTADGRRRADAGRRGETAPGRPRGEIPTRIRQRQIEGHHDRATPATPERIASDDPDV